MKEKLIDVIGAQWCADCYSIEFHDLTSLQYHYSEDEVDLLVANFTDDMKLIEEENIGFMHVADMGDTEEFSTRSCDCCKAVLHGERHKVAYVCEHLPPIKEDDGYWHCQYCDNEFVNEGAARLCCHINDLEEEQED